MMFSITLAALLLARTWLVSQDVVTIQAGLDEAAGGDTVLIACGTYVEHDLVMKVDIGLRSENGDPACVTIDAAGAGRVLDCYGLSQRAHIEGLTFTGGMVVEGWMDAAGGGVRCRDSDLRIADCIFIGNTARIRAGLAVRDATATVERWHFIENDGNAVQSYAASPIFLRCVFRDNVSVGAGIRAEQGASVAVDHTIVAFSSMGAAASLQVTGAISFSCSNLFGNAGGDWTGELDSAQAQPASDAAAGLVVPSA